MDLSESKVIVTGAAGEFGKVISSFLIKKGARVIAIDKDEEGLSALQKDLSGISVHCCDLTNEASVKKLVEDLFAGEKSESPNVLINNAGLIHSAPLVNLLNKDQPVHDMNSWSRTIDINLNALFMISSNVLGKMVANRVKGVVINISSIAYHGNPGQSAYSAAKSAVVALTSTWAKELGPFGIRSVAIAPGFFDTGSTHKALSEGMVKKWKGAVPLKRLGEPKELAHSIQFCIENDYLNGTVLELDGGLTI